MGWTNKSYYGSTLPWKKGREFDFWIFFLFGEGAVTARCDNRYLRDIDFFVEIIYFGHK